MKLLRLCALRTALCLLAIVTLSFTERGTKTGTTGGGVITGADAAITDFVVSMDDYNTGKADTTLTCTFVDDTAVAIGDVVTVQIEDFGAGIAAEPVITVTAPTTTTAQTTKYNMATGIMSFVVAGADLAANATVTFTVAIGTNPHVAGCKNVWLSTTKSTTPLLSRDLGEPTMVRGCVDNGSLTPLAPSTAVNVSPNPAVSSGTVTYSDLSSHGQWMRLASFDGTVAIPANVYYTGLNVDTIEITTTRRGRRSEPVAYTYTTTSSESNYALPCRDFYDLDGTQYVMRVTMGSFVDYIKPNESLCRTLTGGATQQRYWVSSTSVNGPWTAVQSNHMALLGGWDVEAEGTYTKAQRPWGTFWGVHNGGTGYTAETGGCCQSALPAATETAAVEFRRAFTIDVRVCGVNEC